MIIYLKKLIPLYTSTLVYGGFNAMFPSGEETSISCIPLLPPPTFGTGYLTNQGIIIGNINDIWGLLENKSFIVLHNA